MISAIRDGRASVKASGEEEQFIPCATLIVAVGQSIETKHFREAGLPVERGKILTETSGGFSDIPGVFAGGDCATGPATVIKAIAAAKGWRPTSTNTWATTTRSPVMWKFPSPIWPTRASATVCVISRAWKTA